jgi:hypothetical protein
VKHRTKALLIQLLILGVGSAWSADQCNSVSISAKLTADQTFEQEIGGDLVFRIRPEKLGPEGDLHGWIVTLFRKRSPQQDYIYPVNPPIRFNGLQTLGSVFGESSKSSLESAHRMRFLFQQNDYERIQPYLTAALWPYSAPHPDTVGAEYLSALQHLRMGVADLRVLSYELIPGTESIRQMKFQAVFTAP